MYIEVLLPQGAGLQRRLPGLSLRVTCRRGWVCVGWGCGLGGPDFGVTASTGRDAGMGAWKMA